MKKILIFMVLTAGIISGCKKVVRTSYSGVFKLEKQVISGGVRDTLSDVAKMKIYTDHYYIYGGIGPDSIVRVGIGTYALDSGNAIVEHNIFNNRALDSTQIFVVKIKKTARGRTQITPDFGRIGMTRYILTEDYVRLPSAGTSALDGLWELDTLFWKKGRDTTRQRETRFKLFWQGHFMSIRRYPVKDTSSNYKNGFSYGTFSLTGDKLIEEEHLSDHKISASRKVTALVVLKKKDAYKQITTDPQTGVQAVEIYKRVRQGTY